MSGKIKQEQWGSWRSEEIFGNCDQLSLKKPEHSVHDVHKLEGFSPSSDTLVWNFNDILDANDANVAKEILQAIHLLIICQKWLA